MIAEHIHRSVDPRLSEVQKLLALIRNLETRATDERDPLTSENATVLRGLFFVHLYGAFEYSVTLSVEVLLQEMTKVSVPFAQFEHLVHVVALDAHFRSLAEPGLKTKWQKRRDLLTKQISSQSCSLNDTVFHDQLQNVWYRTIQNIFEVLNVSKAPVPEDRIRGYIDEVVDNRNAIAHGRESAHEVGRRTTSAGLAERLEAITNEVNHIIVCFEEYLENRHFIDSRYRHAYTSSPSPASAGPPHTP